MLGRAVIFDTGDSHVLALPGGEIMCLGFIPDMTHALTATAIYKAGE